MVRQFTYVYGVAVIYYFQVQIQDRVVQCFCLSNDTNQTLIWDTNQTLIWNNSISIPDKRFTMSQKQADLGYWPKLLLHGLGLRKSLIKNGNTFISVQIIIRIKHKLGST